MLTSRTPHLTGDRQETLPSDLGRGQTIETGRLDKVQEDAAMQAPASAADNTSGLKPLGFTGPYQCCSPVWGACRRHPIPRMIWVPTAPLHIRLDCDQLALVSPPHGTSRYEPDAEQSLLPLAHRERPVPLSRLSL